MLAAIIAGTATLSASLLQLRSALLREARGPGAAVRRRRRVQLIVLTTVIGAAAVCGFALSQWLTAGKRAAQSSLQRDLQARVAELGRTASELEDTRGRERADIEAGALRRLGAEGVAVEATVAACRPALAVSAPGSTSSPGIADTSPSAGRACTENEASPVTLCATIPANASVTDVQLFSRPAGSDTPWSANRFLPGQEAGEARFAAKYSESAPADGARQVCQGFAHWSTEHARRVRILVRYSW